MWTYNYLPFSDFVGAAGYSVKGRIENKRLSTYSRPKNTYDT